MREDLLTAKRKKTMLTRNNKKIKIKKIISENLYTTDLQDSNIPQIAITASDDKTVELANYHTSFTLPNNTKCKVTYTLCNQKTYTDSAPSLSGEINTFYGDITNNSINITVDGAEIVLKVISPTYLAITKNLLSQGLIIFNKVEYYTVTTLANNNKKYHYNSILKTYNKTYPKTTDDVLPDNFIPTSYISQYYDVPTKFVCGDVYYLQDRFAWQDRESYKVYYAWNFGEINEWKEVNELGGKLFEIPYMGYVNDKLYILKEGYLYYCENGGSWTKCKTDSSLASDYFGPNEIFYNNGMYLAYSDSFSGATCNSMYSTDGKTWYSQTIGPHPTSSVESIRSNGKVFVAAVNNGLYYSTNGTSWTKAKEGTYTHLEYANGKFIAVYAAFSSNSTMFCVQYSSDGKTWYDSNLKETVNYNNMYVQHICYNYTLKLWVLNIYNENTTSFRGFYYSTNGANWTRGSDTSGAVHGLVAVKDIFITITDSRIKISRDAITWKTYSNIYTGSFNNTIYYSRYQPHSIAKGLNQVLVGTCKSGSARDLVLLNYPCCITPIAIGPKHASVSVIGGDNKLSYIAAIDYDTLTTYISYSTDNERDYWTRVTLSDKSNLKLSGRARCSCSYKGLYLLGGEFGLYYSTNGTSWTKAFSGDVYSITCRQGLFIATGWDLTIKYSTDGKTWYNSNLNTRAHNCTFNDDIFVVCSYQDGIYYSTDGASWTCAVSDGSSWQGWQKSYYANGMFMVTNNSKNKIARSYDGRNWEEITTSNKSQEIIYFNNKWWVSYNDVYYSEDNGTTWKPSYYDSMANKGLYLYDNILYGVDSNFVTASADNNTWVEIHHSQSNCLHVCNNIILIGTEYGMLKFNKKEWVENYEEAY